MRTRLTVSLLLLAALVGCTQLDRAATGLVTQPPVPTTQPHELTEAERDAMVAQGVRAATSTLPGGELIYQLVAIAAGFYIVHRNTSKEAEKTRAKIEVGK